MKPERTATRAELAAEAARIRSARHGDPRSDAEVLAELDAASGQAA